MQLVVDLRNLGGVDIIFEANHEQTFLYFIFSCVGWGSIVDEVAELGAAQRRENN
jgi:hypothetical protein